MRFLRLRLPGTTDRHWNTALLEHRILQIPHRTKPVDWWSYEHAIYRQVNGRRLERGAKRHSLNGLLACAEARSHIQIPGSGVGSTPCFGKRCCRIGRGYALLRMLWCGHASRKDWSLTECLSISLPGLRAFPWPPGPRSFARPPRYPCATNHGLPHPYRRAHFCAPTRFR